MQESMMMAEVGGIVKVSGSRMATPLAPPRPGSTPMITPSRMPTSIRARLYQDRATLKPPISELISSTMLPSVVSLRPKSRHNHLKPSKWLSSQRVVYHVPNECPVQHAILNRNWLL